jgi:hypothetical protein
MTITRADIIAAGVITGPMRLLFRTSRDIPSPYDGHSAAGAYWAAQFSAIVDLDYTVDDPVHRHRY